MNVAIDKRMTVDEFLVWAEAQPQEAGKYELLDGIVVVQQSQKWIHSRLKHRITTALENAIAAAGAALYAAPEGPTVRLRSNRAFEPDALVAPLPEPDPDSLEITNPLIVVEVLSPSSARMDTTVKLKGYFEHPTIRHYLIVDPEGRTITHHRRNDAGIIETPVLDTGAVTMSPPGLSITLDDVFGPPPETATT